MTQTTDAGREDFVAWLGIKPCGAAHDLAWAAWQASRRAQVAPQGRKLVPEKPTSEMLNQVWMYGYDEMFEAYSSMLAAAPQPSEAAQLDDINVADIAQAVDSKEVAPVQMPEPWGKEFGDGVWYNIYTENQVRQLLAQHGIK